MYESQWFYKSVHIFDLFNIDFISCNHQQSLHGRHTLLIPIPTTKDTGNETDNFHTFFNYMWKILINPGTYKVAK